ncbi:MAG: preprotein translocase subunit YajC [Hyphomonadaceae bacterium BRH_c29]|jgi:preprotein translocase subunit YajC|nr:MAG: preprotein translocase subunit YajC [Hyphomonadaceae bacterium BRH_c29]
MSNKLVAMLMGAALTALPAAAQEAAKRPGGGMFELLIMPIGLVAIFYFLLIRPQQQRAKKHAALITGLKRGDTVVTTGGLVGKVNKVFDDEVSLEVGENVRVRVIKSMIIEVRGKAEPVAAND